MEINQKMALQSSSSDASSSAEEIAETLTLGSSNELVKIMGRNHHNLFFSKFRHFYQSSGLFDLKIICAGGGFVLCHSLILASCSSQIESMLALAKSTSAEGAGQSDQPRGQESQESQESQWNPSKVISLPEVNQAELEMLVKFVYTGELTLTKSMLGRLCKLSQHLKLTFFPSEKDVVRMIAEYKLTKQNQTQTQTQTASEEEEEEEISVTMECQVQALPKMKIRSNSNNTEMEVEGEEESTKNSEAIQKTPISVGVQADFANIGSLAGSGNSSSTSPELQKKININVITMSTSSGVESQSQQSQRPASSSSSQMSLETVSSGDLLVEETSALDLERDIDIPSMDSTTSTTAVVGRTVSHCSTPRPKSRKATIITSTKAKRPFVQQDLEQGYSLKEIAERYKISYKIVRRWRIEHQRLLMQRQMNSSLHSSSSAVVQSDTEYREKARASKRKFVCSSDEEFLHPELMKKVCKMLISSSEICGMEM